MTCDRCGEPLSVSSYRVTSDVIDMTVCIRCAWTARCLEKYKGTGELTVVEISVDTVSNS